MVEPALDVSVGAFVVEPQELRFVYRNHRGEVAWRHVHPISPGALWFGSTPFHHIPQWFLRALDVDKQAVRDFAVADIFSFRPDHGFEGIARLMPRLGAELADKDRLIQDIRIAANGYLERARRAEARVRELEELLQEAERKLDAAWASAVLSP